MSSGVLKYRTRRTKDVWSFSAIAHSAERTVYSKPGEPVWEYRTRAEAAYQGRKYTV